MAAKAGGGGGEAAGQSDIAAKAGFGELSVGFDSTTGFLFKFYIFTFYSAKKKKKVGGGDQTV